MTERVQQQKKGAQANKNTSSNIFVIGKPNLGKTLTNS
jgi:stage III sporulation protein SpoIIIAA